MIVKTAAATSLTVAALLVAAGLLIIFTLWPLVGATSWITSKAFAWLATSPRQMGPRPRPTAATSTPSRRPVDLRLVDASGRVPSYSRAASTSR